MVLFSTCGSPARTKKKQMIVSKPVRGPIDVSYACTEASLHYSHGERNMFFVSEHFMSVLRQSPFWKLY